MHTSATRSLSIDQYSCLDWIMEILLYVLKAPKYVFLNVSKLLCSDEKPLGCPRETLNTKMQDEKVSISLMVSITGDIQNRCNGLSFWN